MSRVQLEHITKTFGTGNAAVNAVDDISLDVPHHEFMILLGPSGCGKSTLLRMIAGLEYPTSGDVRIGERLVNDVQPKERDVAMVFQSYALYPH
jgi:multiple sugar transport system ATP-binding protein